MIRPLKAVIIDDEPIARKGIEGYVVKTPFLKLEGSFSGIHSFLESNAVTNTEVLFLDIEMPGITGIDFLKSSAVQPPPTVFITAYESYAVEGYDLDVVDYLLKPVSYERFLKAAEKVVAFYKKEENSEQEIWIKNGNTIERMVYASILYIEAMQNYTKIVTEHSQTLILMPFKKVMDKLSSAGLIQVHRSFAINGKKIERIEGSTIYIDGNQVPISRALKKEVIDSIIDKNLLG
jgi:DNA-binding LytR/AlgR family response regulator